MKRIFILVWLALLPCSLARAALTIDIINDGSGGVFAASSGSLNVDGIPFRKQPLTTASFVRGTAFFAQFEGWITIGTGNMDAYDISSTAAFSTGGNFLANSNFGPPVGVQVTNTSIETLFVPRGYTSGAPINSSATWNGQSIASMGLIPGIHVISWGSGANADTLTIRIEGTPPAPSSFPVEVFVSGLTGTGLQLQNNGGDTLIITANDFTDFATLLADGSSYTVAIVSQPTGQSCVITGGGSGTISGDAGHVDVDCATDAGPPPPPPTTTAGSAAAQPVPTLPIWALLMTCAGLGLIARIAERRQQRSRSTKADFR